MNWNNCKLIYKDGEFDEGCYSGTHIFKAYLKYCNNIFKEPVHSVWYDLEENICFGQDQTWLNSTSRNSFFIADKDNFLSGTGRPCNASPENDYRLWDKKFVLNYYGNVFGKNIIENKEIIYFNHPELKKFKDSKILIIGAGPTMKERDWDPQEYDYVWSCNHFFLNEKMKNVDISLAIVGNEVDLSKNNIDFHNYMSKNSTLICFEDRLVNEEQKYFEYIRQRYPERIVYAHTRYRGKIGSSSRLICMASLLGCKEIHVIGMDGFKKGVKLGDDANHSFEKGKKNQGTHDYRLYKRHYVILWDYLLNNIGQNIKFKNLGEGHESNMSSDVSRQMFPLKNNV